MRLARPAGVLLAVGAMLLMAAFASSAYGTVLCKASEETCNVSNQYHSGTTLTASLSKGENAVLSSSFEKVTCTSSTFKNETDNGTPLAGSITSFTLGGCTNNIGPVFGPSCTGSGSVPAKSSISASGGGNGTQVIEGMVLQISCTGSSGTTVCRYGGSMSFSVTGGSPATLSSSVVLAKQSGSSGACAETAKWTASYTVESPSPVFVSNGTASAGTGTALCSLDVAPCPTANRYSEGQAISATSNKIELNGWFGTFSTMSCSSASLSGQTAGVSGGSVAATVGSLSASGCTNNVSSSCSPSFSVSNPTLLTATGGGDGTLSISGLAVKISCASGTVCRYQSGAKFSLQGGTNAVLTANQIPLARQEISSVSCAYSMTLNGSFTLTAPAPLYLESSV